MLFLNTHIQNNEDSGKAEANKNSKDYGQASIYDGKKGKVYVIISGLTQQTQQANRTLETDKKCEVQDEQLVEASKDILLNIGNSLVVTAENPTNRNTDEDAENG